MPSWDCASMVNARNFFLIIMGTRGGQHSSVIPIHSTFPVRIALPWRTPEAALWGRPTQCAAQSPANCATPRPTPDLSTPANQKRELCRNCLKGVRPAKKKRPIWGTLRRSPNQRDRATCRFGQRPWVKPPEAGSQSSVRAPTSVHKTLKAHGHDEDCQHRKLPENACVHDPSRHDDV